MRGGGSILFILYIFTFVLGVSLSPFRKTTQKHHWRNSGGGEAPRERRATCPLPNTIGERAASQTSLLR